MSRSEEEKGKVSRRRFIKYAAVAALGAFSAFLFFRRKGVELEDSGPVEVSDASRKLVEAIAETMIPSDGPERPGAPDVDLAGGLLKFFGRRRGSYRMLMLICWPWEFSPVWSLKFKRFSNLSLEERTRIFEGYESSRWYLNRQSFYLLRLLFLGAFYYNPEIWPHIGYEPGCLSEPPLPIDASD
jgi:hypothetical protein